MKKIVFLAHLDHFDWIWKIDPFFDALTPQQRIRWAEDFGPLMEPIRIEHSVFESLTLETILLELRIILCDSTYFRKCEQTRNPIGLRQIEKALKDLNPEQTQAIGLSLNLSQISEKGLHLSQLGIPFMEEAQFEHDIESIHGFPWKKLKLTLPHLLASH
jgi:hypothetical protein